MLPIVRHHGLLVDGEDGDALRLLVLDRPPWSFRHWTPFNALGREEASSPGYRHALERQRFRPDMPYGFDVRFESRRVMCLLWSTQGAEELVMFEPGQWEFEISRYADLCG